MTAPPPTAAPPGADDARARVLAVLHDIAPEAEAAAIAPDRPLREQVDLDSMDLLNLLDAVGERIGARLDARRLGADATLDDLAAALRAARGDGHARTRRAAAAPVFTLRGGRRVRLRPIVAADTEREAEFVRGLSMRSRYKRFMSSMRELSPAKLRYFTDVDQQRHIALAATPVATRDRAWVGVARCVADPTGDACEFAVTVADDWQGSGLAGVLMRSLMAAARAQGYRTMYGSVLASNRPMLALARQLGFAVSREGADPGTVRVQRAL